MNSLFVCFFFVSFDNVYSHTFSSCFTGSLGGEGPILLWLAFADGRVLPDFCLTGLSFFPEADVTGETTVGI